MNTETKGKSFTTLPVAGGIDLTDEQVKILQATGIIPQGTTSAEIELFREHVRRTQLDPVARQILPMRRKVWNSETRTNEYKMTVLTTIDGFRLIAERTGDYAGQLGPFWCGSDGKWVDVWLQATPPAAAKVGVLRHGFKEPLYSVALWDAYKQETQQGALMGRWKIDPAGMLAKCAEALALRRAFPAEMSGLYTTDEMSQAGAPTIEPDTTTPPQQPAVEMQEPEAPPDPRDAPAEEEQPAAGIRIPTLSVESARTVQTSDGRTTYGQLDRSRLEHRRRKMLEMLAKPGIDPEVRDEYLYKVAACNALIEYYDQGGQPEPKEEQPARKRQPSSEAAERQASILTELGYNENTQGGGKYDDLEKMTADGPTRFWLLVKRANLDQAQAKRALADAGQDFDAAFNQLLTNLRANG